MQLTFTEEQFKANTKMMLDYLKKQGVTLPLSKAYEAASIFCGEKTWNVMAARLKQAGMQDSVVNTTTILTYDVSGQCVTATVTAIVRTDDNVKVVSTNAAAYFLDIDYEALIDLHEKAWAGCEEADDVGLFMEDRDPEVAELFSYQRHMRQAHAAGFPTMGFEVEIDGVDVASFLKAFNYPLYVKYSLYCLYMSGSTACNDVGFEDQFNVRQTPTGSNYAGRWFGTFNGDALPTSYATENDAWDAMGFKLENTYADALPDFEMFVTAKSGRCG